MIKKVKVLNLSSNNIILDEGEIADSFYLRLKGLLGRRELISGKGIIIKPCRSVHTIGMLFPIDVAFVDNDNRICHIVNNMSPSKVSPVIKKSSYVIETPAGTLTNTGAAIGDEVKLEKIYKSQK